MMHTTVLSRGGRLMIGARGSWYLGAASVVCRMSPIMARPGLSHAARGGCDFFYFIFFRAALTESL